MRLPGSADYEFARLPDFRAWERARVKQLVRSSWVYGEPARPAPPIYDDRYPKHQDRFDKASENARLRAIRIYRRYVAPKLIQREQELIEHTRKLHGPKTPRKVLRHKQT
jgi:hypothetical protein